MKLNYLFLTIIFCVSNAKAQVKSDSLELDELLKNILEDDINEKVNYSENYQQGLSKNIVRKSTFKKMFSKDFSAISGLNNSPLGQITVEFNKPEIKIGQALPIYIKKRQIPAFYLYPYLNGKSNSDDEFEIYNKGRFDPRIGSGAQLLINLYGLRKGTGHFFKPQISSTKFFLKKREIESKIIYAFNENTTGLKKLIDDLEKEKDEIQNELNRSNEIQKQTTQTVLTASQIIALTQKYLKLETEIQELEAILKDTSKRDKYVKDKYYEIEKDAPWSFRKYIWLGLQYETTRNKYSVFTDNLINDEVYSKQTFSLSANGTFIGTKGIFNSFAKFEGERKNSFFKNDQVDFISLTQIVSGQFVKSDVKKAYDLSNYTPAQIDEYNFDKIIKLGFTWITSPEGALGLSINLNKNLDKKVTNLSPGVIFPLFIGSKENKLGNGIIELTFPDITSQLPASQQENAKIKDRAFINFKLGLPIKLPETKE